MKTFHIGGIHPKANKLTADKPIVVLPEPKMVTLLLSQSIGAPSKPVVKVGDEVVRGQLVAEAGGFVSANLHSPVNGKVKKIDRVRNHEGRPMDAIIIEANAELGGQAARLPLEANEGSGRRAACPPSAACPPGVTYPPGEIIQRVKEAGIVGLGGAAFPTHVKLMPPEGMTPEVVLVNGAECEPYLTCDDALMQRSPAEIVMGTKLLMQAVKVNRGIIGIEENKPVAIAKIKDEISKIKDDCDIRVEVLKKKYPQGGEKQLIDACLNRQVPSGKLPVATGAIVDNVATVYAVYDAVYNSNPLTHRVVCVTGPKVSNPGNYLVAIGTPIREVIEAAGGVPEGTGKIISGGPMMGRAMSNIDAPTVKGMSGILILPEEESRRHEPEPCIRCGKCVDVCPMGLEPYLLARLSAYSLWDETKQEKVMNCIECGSCSYICPSFRPLLDYIRLAKRQR